MLREKIRRLRSGANPRPWVPEASMPTTRLPKPLGVIVSADTFYILIMLKVMTQGKGKGKPNRPKGEQR
jgi:hypothetical protein